jgi:hypothetical protein
MLALVYELAQPQGTPIDPYSLKIPFASSVGRNEHKSPL